jgi:hypothetical protein
MKTLRTLTIGLLFSGLAACADVPVETPNAPEAEVPVAAEPVEAPPAAPTAVEPVDLSRLLPENVEVDGPWLFAMETTPELLALTLHGSSQERLVGRLADRDGRREIVHYGKNRQAPKVIFRKGWLLPAVGAVNRLGDLLVCVNRLVGATSRLTKGDMPDPANGVDLVCRWRSTRGWTREVRVPREGAALWLSDVVAQKDGSFRITYGVDGTGLLLDDPAEGEGTYRMRFENGRFGEPELARRFVRP